MAPPRGKKLSLPASLLKEIGAEAPGGGKRRQDQQLSRKDQRKAQRVQKKQAYMAPRQNQAQPSRQQSGGASAKTARPKSAATRDVGPGDDDEDDCGPDMEDDSDLGLDEDEDGFDLDEDEGSDNEDDEEEETAPQLSKSERRKLEKEDAEIAALEKKLGLKKGKKSKGDDDGLDDLLADLDDLDEDEEVTSRKKRKAEADEWLAQKRRRASAAAAAAAVSSKAVDSDDDEEEHSFDENEDEEDDNMEDGGDGLSDLGNSDYSDLEGDEGDEDGDDGDGQDFDGFSDEDDTDEDDAGVASAPRQKENPYVAPTTNVAKYVPPSLRKKAESMDEVDAQLRRRVQGLINRLTNENMLGILKDFTTLYDQFPRQNVTSSLINLVLALVCSPERRPDSFFTMVAGFTAASQKGLGIHVSASMVQQLVEVFKQHHDRTSGDQSDAASKHLIALLAELYNMQVVGSKLIFDYVRLFLSNLSELNTELLLRVIQMCGPSLRREDPHALKEIISLIKPADLKNASVRTSFMIDEMKKLQSNKAKAAARNKDLSEMRTQIRKRIGTLSSSREIQPLGMGLTEIENADKNGKWWLVGASWSGNREKDKQTGNGAPEQGGDGDDAGDFTVADDDDLGIPDLWQLAKQQGFNTEVRQQIFVALHSATDYENAEMLLRKLRLNKHQRKELPEVIVRSGEAQAEFNRYYWLVASRFCGDRELAFQFKRCLTQRFKRMGEDIDTGDDYEAEDDDYDTRQVVNVGKFYGNLVAHGSLGLDMLRYRNLAALQEKTQWFVEVLLITVLQESGKEGLQRILGTLDRDLARGVQYFLRKHVRKTDLLKGKEKKAVRKQCEVANDVLEESLAATTGDGAADELT